MEFEKIVLVTRKTRLEGLIERFNTVGQARFYLEHRGGNFNLYQSEHDTYHESLSSLRASLIQVAKVQEIERSLLPNFLFAENEIVVAVGIDGLVANTAKYLNGQPLVAVNPDPKNIDGILLPFDVPRAVVAVRSIMKNQMRLRRITMAEAKLNDGQSLLAFNDFFVGVRSHVSARYRIEIGGQQEHHSSSGIIVSTGVGSSGWLSSMFNMANGMLAGFQHAPDQPQASLPRLRLNWEAERLVFVVREPFISKTSAAAIVCGYVTPQASLIIQSEMPEGGVIFSDGVESDFLVFNSGTTATISLSQKKTNLVVGT